MVAFVKDYPTPASERDLILRAASDQVQLIRRFDPESGPSYVAYFNDSKGSSRPEVALRRE
jgi:hypothetical protein